MFKTMAGRCVVACFAACLLLPAGSQAAAPMTIAVIENGRAFEMVARQVLEEAYRRAGVPLSFKEVPALRALAESAGGQADGELQRIGGLARSYPQLVQVNVPINYFDAVVLTRTARFTPNGWASLRPYTIGYHRGIVAFERGTAGMKTDTAPNNELLLRKLIGGRTDVAVMTDIEARQLLAEFKDNSILILSPPLERVQLYHYVQARHRLLAHRLETVLKAMQAEGVIAEIRSRTLAEAGLE
jgi:polar amino acid transport system substrate-binding protein